MGLLLAVNAAVGIINRLIREGFSAPTADSLAATPLVVPPTLGPGSGRSGEVIVLIILAAEGAEGGDRPAVALRRSPAFWLLELCRPPIMVLDPALALGLICFPVLRVSALTTVATL